MKDLARLGSLAYPAARDLIEQSADPVLRLDLLQAIQHAADASPAALSVVERTLASDNVRLVTEAAKTVSKRGMPVRFARIWDLEQALPIWSWYQDLPGSVIMHTVGVADHCPWRDPAWQLLSMSTQVGLLSRSGTCEAVELLEELLAVNATDDDYHQMGKFLAAERGDPPCLLSMLGGEDPTLWKWASQSLVKVGERSHLRGLLKSSDRLLGEHAAEAIKAGEDRTAIADAALAIIDSNSATTTLRLPSTNFVLQAAMELLSDDELMRLLTVEPDQILRVQRELVRRSRPLSFAELAAGRATAGETCVDLDEGGAGRFDPCQVPETGIRVEPEDTDPGPIGPPLTPDERSWVENLATQERNDALRAAVRFGASGVPRVISCPSPRDTGLGVHLPEMSFSNRWTPDDLPELRIMLVNPDPAIRHFVAVMLCRFEENEPALQMLRQDAIASDRSLRFSALKSLVVLRDTASANFYPELLVDPSPRHRRLGLQGVAMFRLSSQLTSVLGLVADDDPEVAPSAVITLRALRHRAAVPLLIRLVKHEYQLAPFASAALANFHEPDDIDKVIEAMASPGISETSQRQLLTAFQAMTYKLFNPVTRALDPVTGARPEHGEMVDACRVWWQTRRSESVEAWVRQAVTFDLARIRTAFVKGEPKVAGGSIKALFDIDLSRPDRSSLARHQVSAIEGQVEDGDLWILLTAPSGRVLENVDLLMAIDANRTLAYLVHGLLRLESGASKYDKSRIHEALVRASGLDFGNPSLAIGQHSAVILARWREWAASENWWQVP